MRGIERTFGVSRRTLSAWLKEQANDFPPLEETLQPVECKKIPVLEMDELRSFVFRSKDKVWVWIAMNRETREIVASACGDRSENTCRVLWDRVPSAYKEAIVFSDYWSAYRAVIPSEKQRPVGKETGETAHSEYAKVILCKEKTGISGVHTFRKLNSEKLYAISRTICGPGKSPS